jgi:hypothetical protein
MHVPERFRFWLLAAVFAGIWGCAGDSLSGLGGYCETDGDCEKGLVCTSWNICMEPGTFCDPPCNAMTERCVQGDCQSTDHDGDGFGEDQDCDDDDPDVHPDAAERCNRIDDDCDGDTDEGCDCVTDDEQPCGAGVGECVLGTQTCLEREWGGCLDDDGEPVRMPGDVVEDCNGLDDDCDGYTDEGEACFPRPGECNEQDWCLEHPLGGNGSGSLGAVHGRAPNDVWAVGVNGVILHFDGRRWSTSAWEGPGVLQDVWSFAPDDVWAVGWEGLALHYNGTVWLSYPSGTDAYLVALAGLSSDSLWAVADRGTILHWNGQDWSLEHFEEDTTLYDAFAFASDDVWVVGSEYGPGGNGKVLNWDGAVWSPVVNLPQDVGALHSIWGRSSRDLWLADTGWGVDHDGMLIHYDGSVWETYPYDASLGAVTQIWGLAESGDVWSVHLHGGVQHWDGTTWTTITPQPTDKLLNGVWAVQAGPTMHVWIAGADRTILHHIE